MADSSAPPAKRRKTEYTTGGYVCEFVKESNEIEGEIWKKIPDSLAPGNNTYVSNLGRVKARSGVVTTPTPRQNGYASIQINDKRLYVHRLVLAAFDIAPSSEAHKFVNHKDLNPSNNRLENLEWCTQAENMHHSFANNAERGNNVSKVSKPVRGKRVGDVNWVTYESAADAARNLGLDKGNISKCCRKGGKTQDYYFEFTEPNEPTLLSGEVWKKWDAVEISNLGRYKDQRGVVKTPKPETSGYARVTIGGTHMYVHRLVAQLFLPPPEPGQTEVDHINGKGNQQWNLRWATRSENIKHSHTDPERKSNAPTISKKVRCRKVGSSEWHIFPSSHEASRKLGIWQGNIIRSCRNHASACVER